MEWERLEIPLGLGLADALPQDSQGPHPSRLEGLLPGPGRLYSFQEARRVPHQLVEELLSVDRATVAFDHLGMRYRQKRTATQTLFYLEDERDGKQEKTGLANDEEYPSMAFFEQAGMTGLKASGATDLYHILQGDTADSTSSHTPGGTVLNWSMAVAGQASGELDDYNGGVFTDARVQVVAVRCVKTEAGLMGVSTSLQTDVLDLSTEGGALVTVTQTDSVDSYYVLYGQFTFSDDAATADSIATDWLLLGTLNTLTDSTPEFVISTVPIGETLPGGTGGYLLQPYAGSMAVRHHGRFFAVSGTITASGTTGIPDLVAAPSSYVRSLGGIAALPAGRSVVYSAGLAIANMGTHATYFTPQLSASERITALVSSPAGLLIFGDNEVLIARGNPDSTDFRVEPISAVIGCDPGVIPARLGGVVFTVHRGRVWAVNLGSGQEGLTDVLSDISAAMRVPDVVSVVDDTGALELTEGGFVDVRADSRHSQVVALRRFNRSKDGAELMTSQVYRYDLRSGQWFDDPIALNGGWALSGEAGSEGEWAVYPCADEYGLRYYPLFDLPLNENIPAADWTYRYSPRYFVGRQGGSFVLEFRDLDCGLPREEKQFRRVHLFAHGLWSFPDSLVPADAIPFLGELRTFKMFYRIDERVRGPDSNWIEVESQPHVLSQTHAMFEFADNVLAESISVRIEGRLFRYAADYPGVIARSEDRLLSTPYLHLDSPLVIDYRPRRSKNKGI